MLEDTNSLDGAHVFFNFNTVIFIDAGLNISLKKMKK